MDEQKPIEQSDIKILLQKNLEMTEEIFVMTKKIKSYIAFQRLMSLIYVFLIVAPIILSLIYLPPLLKGLTGQYKDFMSTTSIDPSILDSIKK